jgi:hypothetical protein
MPKFNGHKNWNHWNVSLWLNNDERFYGAMVTWIEAAGNLDRAARGFHYALTSGEYGDRLTHTPDGAPYSIASIRAAMVGHGRGA